jgi:hypothetical protein
MSVGADQYEYSHTCAYEKSGEELSRCQKTLQIQLGDDD